MSERAASSLLNDASACALCGLPAGRWGITAGTGDATLHFCCPGCRHVFHLLSSDGAGLPLNFRETDLFRACVKAGIVPADKTDGDNETAGSRDEQMQAVSLVLRVEGMWCPSCAWVIEEVLRRTRGLTEVNVSFLADSIRAQYFPHIITVDDIRRIIARLGYHGAEIDRTQGKEPRNSLIRLGLSAIFTQNVMMLSLALYFGFFGTMTEREILYFSYPLFLLSTPVVFWGGYPLLKRGFTSLRYFAPSMDTLVSIAALAAFTYSCIGLLQGSLHLYFDTASILVTLVLLGRYIESRMREKVTSSVTQLHELIQQKVRILEDGRERWVKPDTLEKGREFIARAGEPIPRDAVVISGKADIDQSALTGEAKPRTMVAGSLAHGGSIVRTGELVLRASGEMKESLLGQIIQLVDDALSRRNGQEALAERLSRLFVPAVLAVSCGAGIWLWHRGLPSDDVLMRMLAVLLIACPCSLGIASPLVKVAMVGIARKKGVVVREPDAIEQTRKIDVVVLDKTGTLTNGIFALLRVVTDGPPRDEVLATLAAIEERSSHFIAREIMRSAKTRAAKAEGFEELEGQGVRGRTGGKEVSIGNRRLMSSCGLVLSEEMDREAIRAESEGFTVAFFGWSGRVRGFLVFGDELRDEAVHVVRALQSSGVSVRVVSGDGIETTRAVATRLGAEGHGGQMLPQEKAEFVKNLQADGHRVGMVGDGVNDAAALAQADVSFAFAAGGQVVREVSDLIILNESLSAVLDVINLSRRAGRTIRNNLAFAFLYNISALPLAVTGLLNPLIAVAIMFASSLLVTANALLLFRLRPTFSAS